MIDRITPDQLDLPTPCPEHDVRSLLGHVADVMARVRLMGEGGNPMANGTVDVTAVPDDGWFDLFRSRAHEVQAAWTDPAALERTIVLPWATAPGAAMLGTYTSELTVHTWDLATATGQHPQWDDEVVAFGFGAISRGIPAADRRARFEEVVADDAARAAPVGAALRRSGRGAGGRVRHRPARRLDRPPALTTADPARPGVAHHRSARRRAGSVPIPRSSRSARTFRGTRSTVAS